MGETIIKLACKSDELVRHAGMVWFYTHHGFFPKRRGGGGGERRGKMRLYELLGRAITYPCAKQCSPRKFDFGPFIRRNLVESGAVFAQT